MSHRGAHEGPAGPHLDGHELVDALEGTLDARRLAHASSCAACTAQLDELRAVASEAATVDVPEPPAFFWNQLSARVRASIAEAPLPGPWSIAWRRSRPAIAIAAAVVIVGTVASLTGLWPQTSSTSRPPAVVLQTQDDDETGEDVFAEIDSDEAWALVRTLAEDLDHEQMEGEGVSARPGAANRLTSELTAAERIELARLLEEQLKGRTIPDSAS